MIIRSDARHIPLRDGVVDCCVTSPPYWGLRDYGHSNQTGLEKTPSEYVSTLVAVFREVWRVLKPKGTLWLNLGDSYAVSGSAPPRRDHSGTNALRTYGKQSYSRASQGPQRAVPDHLKPKDLVGIPWRVAFALQADGWYLRSDIIWAKPNPMPESVTDRPSRAHDYVFLLTKSQQYFYDAVAIQEPLTGNAHDRGSGVNPKSAMDHGSVRSRQNESWSAAVRRAPKRSGNKARKIGEERGRPGSHLGGSIPWEENGAGRNKRSVWNIATQPYKGAHFATMPEALARVCIKAGCPPGGLVFDPFGGSGTTAQVALEENCKVVICDIGYQDLQLGRLREIQPNLKPVPENST